MPKPSKIRDSVVAIFAHAERFFIIERQPYLPAFPGYHSFPGGKVDREDSEAPYALKFLQDHEPKLMRALCREIQEEINFDLATAIEQGQVENFSAFGEAITPAFNPIRFHARFYRIDLKAAVDFDVERNEAAWAGWMSAEDFMTHYQQGQLLTAFPALCAMKAFAQDPQAKNIGVMHLTYDREKEVPSVQPIYQLLQMPVRSNTQWPSGRTNAFILGDEQSPRYLIDPSPASQEEWARLHRVVAGQGIQGILLTHHSPDRHEFSNELARTLRVPMRMSEEIHARICQTWGEDYFAQIDLQWVKEGDVLTQWIGKDVLVFDLPGKEESQLGLAPESMEWFFVGDLLQGMDAGSASAEEWRKAAIALEKVIALDPKILVPAHGMPVKTTFRLKEILKEGSLPGN